MLGATSLSQHPPMAHASFSAARAPVQAQPANTSTSDSSQFERLSLQELALVLQSVELRPRLSTCALVSSTWRAAAAIATTSIDCSFRHTLPPWLVSHTAAVAVTSLSLTALSAHLQPLLLPVEQLRSLQALKLVSVPWRAMNAAPAAPAAQPAALAALTALTSLELSGCSVVLDGLAALTQLLLLSCQTSRAAQPASEAALLAALPRLQRLTSLTVDGSLASAAVVAQTTCLQHLQQLALKETMTTSFTVFPQSLTQLDISFAFAVPSCTLDTAVLANLSSLRELTSVQFTASSSAQLIAFSRLTKLQRLHFSFTSSVSSMTPAEAAVLATTSNLTSLHFGGLSRYLQPAHYEAMFPAGRQLQHLVDLSVSTSLVSSTDVVRQVASCCRNLTSLELQAPSGSAALSFQECSKLSTGVRALAAFSTLKALRLTAGDRVLFSDVWWGLASLKGLTSLEVVSKQPGIDHVAHLGCCRSLEQLSVSEGTWDGFNINVRSQAPAGSPPDVWEQLPYVLFEEADMQMLAGHEADDYSRYGELQMAQVELARLMVDRRSEQVRRVRSAEAQAVELQHQLRASQQEVAELKQHLAAAAAGGGGGGGGGGGSVE